MDVLAAQRLAFHQLDQPRPSTRPEAAVSYNGGGYDLYGAAQWSTGDLFQ